MKVCVLTTVHDYNDNRVYYKETLSLLEMGYDIVYMAQDASKTGNKQIKCVDLKSKKTFIQKLLYLFEVFRIARAENCDVYHFHDPELIYVGLLLKMFTKAKVVYDVHEDYPSQMLSKFYLKSWMRKPLYHIMRFSEKLANKYFDAIITADNFVEKHFTNKKTIVVYNYPDVKKIEDSISDRNAEKQWDVIFPGSMSWFTTNMILEAVKIVRNKWKPIKTILISPFHEGGISRVENRIKDLGLDLDDFILMKNIPPYNVPNYIVRSRIGLIPLQDTPKMRSNIPTKLFEYMYCGIPVVVADLPPMAQYLNSVDVGFMVNPNSAQEYADKIIFLLENTDVAKSMGEDGFKLVSSEYNWNREKRKMEKLYASFSV